MSENQIELLIKATDQASGPLNKITGEINSLGAGGGTASAAMADLGQSTGGATSRIVEFAAGMGLATVAVGAMTAVWAATIGSMKRGIEAIDELKLAQASMAAAAATNDLSLPFNKAYNIAGAMVEKVHELSATFVGTGHELSMLADSMVTFGMGLDLSNEKAEKNFVSFGNLMKIMTRGQDFQRQAYQEIRALMEGADVPGAMLVKKLEAAGIKVKEMVPLWREQGTLLENIMKALPGYGAAQDKIAATLQTQKTTLQTITEKILKDGMAPAYEQIAGWLKDMNASLYDHGKLTKNAQTLVDILKGSWTLISGVIEGIGVLLRVSVIPAVTTMVDLLKKGAEAYGGEGADAMGMVVPGQAGVINKILNARLLKGGMQSLEEERDKWAEGGGMKFPGGMSQPTDAMLRATEHIQKMIEDMKDKIAIEAARERGGAVEAELEKAAIDWRKRNEAIKKTAEAAGKSVDADAVNKALRLSSEERTGDEIKALEKQRDAAIKITQKTVDEREKQEQHLADAIENIRMRVQEREAQRQEKYLEMMAQYNESLRQAQERMPRPWDAPGVKEREREMHDFVTEQNKLEALKRRGEERLPGGIDPDRYKELMDKLVQVHEEKLAQIEDTTSQTTKRVEQLWMGTFSAISDTSSNLFFDVWQGKLKSMGDYFNSFANSIAQAWSRTMGDMVAQWIMAQASMETEGGLMSLIGGLFVGAKKGVVFGAEPFAKGDVFGSPRLFRFAQGVGMLGEAGPEGVQIGRASCRERV